MNILVLGNGFDLAHGLPTKYTDFLEFVSVSIKYRDSKEMEIFTNSFNDTPIEFVDKCFKKFLEEKNRKLSFDIDGSDGVKRFIEKNANRFYEAIRLTENVSNHINFWIQYFAKKLKEKKLVGENWVDFEHEITECVNLMETAKKNPNSFKAIMAPIISILANQSVEDQYLTNIDDIMAILEKDLTNLIVILEIYILLVNQLKVERNDAFEKLPSMEHIISFNYTDTYKKYWKGVEVNSILEDFVHGKAGNGNIILGAGETLAGDDVNKELSCVKFKKYFQRIHNRTGSKYRRFIIGTGGNKYGTYIPDTSVYIYGHSLDITDKDILSYIILHEYTKEVTVYYYKAGKKSDYEQSIMNLIQVIGKEELTARVGEGRIKFISTEDLGGKSEKAIV